MIFSVLCLAAALAVNYGFIAKMDREPAIYAAGETAKVHVQVFKDGQPFGGARAVCSWNYIGTNVVTIAQGGTDFELKLDRPGQVLFRGDLYDETGTNRLRGTFGEAKPRALIAWAGALFSPEKLKPSRPRPADFDVYWDGEIARMNRLVPMSPGLTRVTPAKVKEKGFVSFDVEIPCWPRPACAAVVLPEKASAGSLPAVVEFQGHGGSRSIRRSITNTLYMCVNAHGLGNDRPQEDWSAYFKGEGDDYQHRGWESRETCFFHGQILRAVRALQWLKTRPEWNGRDLAVVGGSMGGSQSIQAAALDKDVTMCAPRDPAMCDHAGMFADPPHRSGWPWILANPRHLPAVLDYGPADPELLKVSDYFDNVFFAARIRCPFRLSSGLSDDVCFSEGVMRAYNAVKGPKSFVTNPYAIHCGTVNPEESRLLGFASSAAVTFK